MNLRNLILEKLVGTVSGSQDNRNARNAAPSEREAEQARADSNVVTFPLTPTYYDVGRGGTESRPDRTVTPDQAKHASLIDSPELVAYFRDKYFEYGYHTGARFRSAEALEMGRQERIAEFQNVVTGLIQRRQTKIRRLHHELLGIEEISAVTSAQLRYACEHLEEEIAVLRDQHTISSEGKGWIRRALAPYEAGFAKGLRTAIEFDLLAG